MNAVYTVVQPLAPLIFPALAAGEGVIFNCRLTRKQERALQVAAARLDVRTRAGGLPSMSALLRALGEGEIVMARREAPVSVSVPAGTGAGETVHRGCPADP